MKLLLFLAYFLFSAKSERAIVIEAQDAQLEAIPLERAVPREVKPVPQKKKVEIEIDSAGKVSASLGAKKLEGFDSTKEAKMKPLNDWLTKVQEKEEIQVGIKVDGEVKQKVVIDVLNVLAAQKISSITFTDFPKK